MEVVIKKLAHRNCGPDGFKGKLYQSFKAELITILLKQFQKIQKVRRLASSFYEASIILFQNQVKHDIEKKLQANAVMKIKAKILNKMLATWIHNK